MYLCKQVFTWNLVYLENIGFLYSRRLAYFVLSVPVAMWFAAMYKLIGVFGDFDDFVALIFVACGLTALDVRVCVMVFKYKQFLNLFETLEKWYFELQFENDATTIKNLQKFIRNARRISNYSFCTLMFGTLYSITTKLISNTFLVEIRLPVIDAYDNPFYLIISALQSLWVIPIGLLTYTAYTSVMLVSIYFGIFLMRDIQRKLENMHELNELAALKCVKKCMRRQAMIIKFHHDLEELFSFANFFDVSFFFLIPCMIIVHSTMENNSAIMGRDIQMVVIVSIVTFVTFWMAGIFCVEGENIAHAAYNSNWTFRDKNFRGYITLIIAVSQKPLELTAGGVKPLNMQTFMAILRSTYSLFTILQGTMNTN